MPELRSLTPAGIDIFERFLVAKASGVETVFPTQIIEDPDLAPVVADEVLIESLTFRSRFEMAKYLHGQFESAGFSPNLRDTGLWTWIAALFFYDILPKNNKVGSISRWVLREADYRRYYRHLVAGPYGIYRAHRADPPRAMAVLCQKPGSPGDIVEQLASRQDVVSSPSIMQVATWSLLTAPPESKPKQGAGGAGRNSARRFVDVLRQFEVTWDLTMMPPERLYDLFPSEFHGGQRERQK